MDKWTPGPWVVKFRADGSAYISMGNHRVGQHKQFDLMLEAGRDNDEADASVISAAPDSHDANVKFVEAIECLCGITPAWSDDRIYDELPSSGLAVAYLAARAAIAKATGGQP